MYGAALQGCKGDYEPYPAKALPKPCQSPARRCNSIGRHHAPQLSAPVRHAWSACSDLMGDDGNNNRRLGCWASCWASCSGCLRKSWLIWFANTCMGLSKACFQDLRMGKLLLRALPRRPAQMQCLPRHTAQAQMPRRSAR
eukprot:scaffold53308_cov20-Tisochrysis_lutea.AAC.4